MKIKVKQAKTSEGDTNYDKPTLFRALDDINYIVMSLENSSESTYKGIVLSPPFNSPQLLGITKGFLKREFKPLEKGASLILKN